MKRLTYDEFKGLLSAEIRQAGSQKVFAANVGVSQQFITDLLKDRRRPGPKLLHSLGFREVRLYERSEGDEE